MPQPYNHAVITDAGISLLNKAQAGQCAIQFTRMAAGNGVYELAEKTESALRKRTALKSEKNSYPLSSFGCIPTGGVKLTALITNQNPATGEVLVNEGYYINEIGLFAKEKEGDVSTEVLYSITTAVEDGDYMPPYNGGNPVQIGQEYHASVSRDVEVFVQYSGAVMLADGDASNTTVMFKQAAERADIQSGDTLAEAFGKLSKYLTDIIYDSMSGATENKTGAAGLVPAPEAGAQDKFLCGDGTWKHTPVLSGPQGEAGVSAGFGPPTATVDANVGIPSVTVTSSGSDTEKIFNFYFKNLKGETGDKGADGKNAAVISVAAQLTEGWSGSQAPYTQTIAVSGVTEASTVVIDVDSKATAGQLDAYINAKIIDGGQAADSITLKAFGDKPEVAIPIKILIIGD